jgi:uncharacterized protein YbaA (DUF1428 family)
MSIQQALQNEIEDSKRWIECIQEDSTYKRDLAKRIELISNVSIVIIMTDTNSSKELNSGGYLAAYFYRVPKKNHNAISQNLKKFIPWFVSNGVRLEYYHLAGKDTQETIESANASGMFIMVNITKTLAAEDEDIWMELQYFRDQNHRKEVYAKMMSDKSLEPLGKEFMGLISHGGNLITGMFNRLEQ